MYDSQAKIIYQVPRSDVIKYCTERWILYIPPFFSFAPELNLSSFINGQDLLSLSSCLCPQLPWSVSPWGNFIYPTPSCIAFIVCSSWEVRADDKPGFMVPLSLHPCQLAIAPMYTVVNWLLAFLRPTANCLVTVKPMLKCQQIYSLHPIQQLSRVQAAQTNNVPFCSYNHSWFLLVFV